MDIQTELRLARERIQHLTQKTEYLEELLKDERERFAPVRFFPGEWALTPKETKLLAALGTREIVSRDNLMTALYPPHERDEINPKIVEVLICKIRAKLKPVGISIHTRFGMGWYLDANDRKRVTETFRRAA